MAERTTQVVHVGCGCGLCAPFGAYVVAHEYVLRESRDRGGSGTAIYRRSFSARRVPVGLVAAPG